MRGSGWFSQQLNALDTYLIKDVLLELGQVGNGGSKEEYWCRSRRSNPGWPGGTLGFRTIELERLGRLGVVRAAIVLLGIDLVHRTAHVS